MSMDAGCGTQFRSMQEMVQQGGRSGLVRLDFATGPDKTPLYAHEAYLMSASGVLRSLLEYDEDAEEDAAEPSAKVARTSDCSDAKAARLRAIIPLQDDSTIAWEEALSLLYPSTMMSAKVTWDNAERLLLLADRYDMPCITEHVDRFMSAGTPGSSRLKCCLTSDDVFKWLPVFSRCGLDEQASICIQHIVHHQLQLPAGFLSSGIQRQYLEQLYNSMQQHSLHQLAGLTQQLREARQEKDERLPLWPGYRCVRCATPWFKMWGLSATPNCVCCGADRATNCVVAECSDSEDEESDDSDDEDEDEDEAGSELADADVGMDEISDVTTDGDDGDNSDAHDSDDEDESDEDDSDDASDESDEDE
eukprot:GHUV01013777.1.p1 GENE.GHUV01013777.1~~GHUV01013777.1.p1  ORF type:complete len:363 (+),score=89.05 GHUV01013777.1:684-1772(+)